MSSARTERRRASPTAAKALSPAACPKVVVVAFEVVEIEHHDGEGTVFAASGVEFAIQELLHVAAVVKAGERVADGLQAERFPEVEVGNGERDVFGDGGGEMAAASKGVRSRNLRRGSELRMHGRSSSWMDSVPMASPLAMRGMQTEGPSPSR